MGLAIEDYLGRLKEIEAERRDRAETKIAEWKAVRVANSELKIDPKWKVYADQILAQKQVMEKQEEVLAAKLLGAFLLPEEYGKVKVAHAVFLGWEAALEWALKIVEETAIDNKDEKL